jgi:hypothetical protein
MPFFLELKSQIYKTVFSMFHYKYRLKILEKITLPKYRNVPSRWKGCSYFGAALSCRDVSGTVTRRELPTIPSKIRLSNNTVK